MITLFLKMITLFLKFFHSIFNFIHRKITINYKITGKTVNSLRLRNTLKDADSREGEGERAGTTDRLVGLGAALVTRVRRHLHHRLHLGGARHDALHAHQLADVVRLHVTDREVLLAAGGLEVDLTTSERGCSVDDLSHQLLRFANLTFILTSRLASSDESPV